MINFNKPLIDIDLQPLLIDFLYHEFQEQEEGLIVETNNDIGKYINSMITVSATPPNNPVTEHHVVLYLPIRSWNHHILSGNFITILPWKRRLLEQYIQAEFNIRVREFFIAGYEKGYSQTRIIEAFLSFYSIKNNTINFDCIKKKDYRTRERITEEVKRGIQLNLDF